MSLVSIESYLIYFFNKENKHACRNKQKAKEKDDLPHMDAHLEVTNKRPGAIWSSCTKEDVIKAMEHEPLDMNKHQNRPVGLGDRGYELGYIGVYDK